MAVDKNKICPTCGNEIIVNLNYPKFQCRYCKHWMKIEQIRKGHKIRIEVTATPR